MDKRLKFKLLKDAPASKKQEGYFKFYHESFSPALKEIIENETSVHTIGLFGPWGSGKSTIIKQMEKDLGLKVFIFDAWKYQEDSLRRIFLIRLVEFLRENGTELPEDILDPIYKSTERTVEDHTQKKKESFLRRARAWINRNGLLIVLGSLLAIREIFLANPVSPLISPVLTFGVALSAFGWISSLVMPVITKILERAFDDALSFLRPVSEMRTKVERLERLNSPEQFEHLFNKIIEHVNPDNHFVIVFDNIDRVHGDTAIKILSTIKTFLGPAEYSLITFLVPCDAEAIRKQLRRFYGAEMGDTDSSEYLRKIFNLIMYTPEFIDTDLESYAWTQLQQTGEVSNMIASEDVVLIISSAFSGNPREIKQFINNLVSAVLVVSKTEVSDLVLAEEKIPYLAKVLVLKQKFPEGYARLKERWHDPENIVESDNEKELVDFLNATSRITTDDAEPYIYFKKPSVSGDLNDSDRLRTALATGDVEDVRTCVASERNKGSVLDFILLLMRRYQNQEQVLLKMFNAQLVTLAELDYEVRGRKYFDASMTILDSKLWKFYQRIPVELVFSHLLDNKKGDRHIQQKIIDRYILTLSNEQQKQVENEQFVTALLEQFRDRDHLLSSGDVKKISIAIEKDYATNGNVLSVFTERASQEKFVTRDAFEQYIRSISRDNFDVNEPVLMMYLGYLTSNDFGDVILVKIREWVDDETAASPEFRPEKGSLLKTINRLLAKFKSSIKELDPNERNAFGKAFLKAFSAMPGWDNRHTIVITLRRIYPFLDDPQKSEAVNYVQNFYKEASAGAIRQLLSYYNKDSAQMLLGENLDVVLPRAVADSNARSVIYDFANKDQRLTLIRHLIANSSDHGLAYVKSLEGLPDRLKVLQSLLEKASEVAPEQRVDILNYVCDKLALSDNTNVKDKVVSLLVQQLKDENQQSRKIAHDFLAEEQSLGDERRRAIAKEALKHLRQPGRSITINDVYLLRSVALFYGALQATPRGDFVYLLFDNVRHGQDRAVIETCVEILKSLRPGFVDHEKDFVDLLERLRNWPDDDNQKYVIDEIKHLKSDRPKVSERSFWKSLEVLGDAE